MMDPHATTLLAGQLALLMGVGALLARGAEWLGQPRLVGALLAGVLLGPMVFGDLAPETYERVMVGASAERAALHEMDVNTAKAIDDAKAIQVTEVYVKQLEAERPKKLAPLQEALDRAEAEASRPLGWAVLGAIVVALLAVGRRTSLFWATPRFHAPAMGLTGVLICGALTCWLIPLLGFGPSEGSSMTADLWLMGALVGCGATAAPWLVSRPTGAPPEASAAASVTDAMLASAALVPFVAAGYVIDAAWRLAPVDDPSQALSWGSLTIVSGVAAAAFLVLLLGMPALLGARRQRWVIRRYEPAGIATLVVTVTVATMWFAATLGWHPAVGALIAALVLSTQPAVAQFLDRTLGPVADYAAEPLVIAYIGTQLTFAGFSPWLALVVLILFGDGKAIGAMGVGWFALRQSAEQAFRTGTAIATGGFIPLVIALMLRQANVIDDPLFASLVLANLVTAVVAGPMVHVISLVARRTSNDTPSVRNDE
ncbi:MAG: hypothetical protein GC159_05885 [Phycisphaera sp.]|nr:hypothetical protein [Phycisphaera sp.]